ncbi:hypothetical protein FB451DRAFT_1167777 [Mycena latifolia]|nr:hypothetical protein FB451DRAFT_1167777 [Mycena latifolia]
MAAQATGVVGWAAPDGIFVNGRIARENKTAVGGAQEAGDIIVSFPTLYGQYRSLRSRAVGCISNRSNRTTGNCSEAVFDENLIARHCPITSGANRSVNLCLRHTRAGEPTEDVSVPVHYQLFNFNCYTIPECLNAEGFPRRRAVTYVTCITKHKFLDQTAPDLYGVMAAVVFLIDVPQISNSAEPRKDLEPRLGTSYSQCISSMNSELHRRAYAEEAECMPPRPTTLAHGATGNLDPQPAAFMLALSEVQYFGPALII